MSSFVITSDHESALAKRGLSNTSVRRFSHSCARIIMRSNVAECFRGPVECPLRTCLLLSRWMDMAINRMLWAFLQLRTTRQAYTTTHQSPSNSPNTSPNTFQSQITLTNKLSIVKNTTMSFAYATGRLGRNTDTSKYLHRGMNHKVQ